MSGYKPFLAPMILSTELRNSRFLSAPTAQAQQGGRTRGAGEQGSEKYDFKILILGEFLGRPVISTLHSHYQEPGFHSWSGN